MTSDEDTSLNVLKLFKISKTLLESFLVTEILYAFCTRNEYKYVQEFFF